jgi:hypothetical protein
MCGFPGGGRSQETGVCFLRTLGRGSRSHDSAVVMGILKNGRVRLWWLFMMTWAKPQSRTFLSSLSSSVLIVQGCNLETFSS